MERLSFDSQDSYSGVEAAIHIARYALARCLCKDKKVLDIACGEGYGSRLLLEWGASEVVGIDSSESAIARASSNFASPGIRYLKGDAAEVAQLVSGEKFDLIVSLETIEHLSRPSEFLAAIANLRAEHACVLITCPNDWWYYPKDDEGNVYHVCKYTQEEFVDLVTSELGKPDVAGVGVPSLGFVNLPINSLSSDNAGKLQIDMMKCTDHGSILILPPETGSVFIENTSYFVVAWGIESKQLSGGANLPISMDLFSSGFWRGKMNSQNISLEELTLKLRSAEAKLEGAVKEISKLSNLDSNPVNNQSEIEKLSAQLEEQQLLTQKFRNQANALFHETSLLQQALARKDEVLSQETSLLQQALVQKDQIIADQEVYLRALLKRWNLVTALPRKILPSSLIAGIKKLVKRFKHNA